MQQCVVGAGLWHRRGSACSISHPIMLSGCPYAPLQDIKKLQEAGYHTVESVSVFAAGGGVRGGMHSSQCIECHPVYLLLPPLCPSHAGSLLNHEGKRRFASGHSLEASFSATTLSLLSLPPTPAEPVHSEGPVRAKGGQDPCRGFKTG